MSLLKIIKKLINRVVLLSREIFYEQIHLWHMNQKINIPSEDLRFISLNRRYWKRTSQPAQEKMILVEGFFAASGHNYLLRTGMLAKAVQEQTHFKIAVLFDKPSYKLVLEQEKYKSFGIEKFLHIKPKLRSIVHYLKAAIVGFKYYRALSSVDDILQLNHNGILFGDLIYDDLLKSEKNKYTIEKKDILLLKRMIQAFYYYYCYVDIFKTYQFKYFIATHLVYAQYGILARVALRYGVNVIETNDLMINFLNFQDYTNKLIGPTYHSVLKEKINKILLEVKNRKDLINFAEQELNKRISGAVDQFDARFAFQNKKKVSKEEFCQKINLPLNGSRPIVVIFSHVFSDAPHCSEKILFRDYYDWLRETLQFVHTLVEIDWVIKPHPASAVYNEEGIVEGLVEKIQHTSLHKNIFIFPKEVTAANLYEIAHAVITVQGTAGIEFSCLGLPTILAGKAFYSGEGFTYDPSTKEEYFDLLKKIAQLPKLSLTQVMRAKEIYAAYARITATQSDIIISKALDAIWGYGENKESNIEWGNKIINDQLEKYDPKNELQYMRMKEYLS